MSGCGTSLPLDPWGDAENCTTCNCSCGSGASTVQITNAEDIGILNTTATIQYTRDEYNRIMSVRGTVDAGVAPYTVVFIINATLARDGDKIFVTFSLPASTNPTVEFRTQGVNGTFATCQPDGTATRYYGIFTYLNGAWYTEDSFIS
jgi:hypothetical protein